MRMEIISGRIERLLTNSAAEVNGLVLDSGRAFAFPPEKAKELLQIVTIGTFVEIEASVPAGCPPGTQLDATRITNCLSGTFVTLSVLSTQAPEVRAEICPPPGTAYSPLAPPCSTLASERDKQARAAIPQRATRAVEQAYDRLHRCHAMLAFLKKSIHDLPDILQYLHESKRTYMQALTRYQAWDFEGACECAAASESLAQIVEILIAGPFNSLPLLSNSSGEVPPAESFEDRFEDDRFDEDRFDEGAAHNNLSHTESALGRIHWITTNGTLPSEDREQVLKLVSWSEQLKQWANRLQDIGADDEAGQFSRAAQAAAGAAEHVCKKCYVTPLLGNPGGIRSLLISRRP